MGDTPLTKDQLVAAMSGLSDVERASIYAASTPTHASVTEDQLKAMTPQQIIDAHRAGRLDQLGAARVERKEQSRAERAERNRAARALGDERAIQRRVDGIH